MSSARTSADSPRPNQRTATPRSLAAAAIDATRRVVGVQHGEPTGPNRLHEFLLGLHRGLDAAEAAGVRHPDHQHDADVGRHETRQPRDLAGSAGAELADEEARRRGHPQHGERRPHLVVERGDRGDGLALAGEDAGEQVLRRRLAVRSGDADDPQVVRSARTRATTSSRQGGERRHDIGERRSARRPRRRAARRAPAPHPPRRPCRRTGGRRSRRPASPRRCRRAAMLRESVSTAPETTVPGSSPLAGCSCPPVTWAISASVIAIMGAILRACAGGRRGSLVLGKKFGLCARRRHHAIRLENLRHGLLERRRGGRRRGYLSRLVEGDHDHVRGVVGGGEADHRRVVDAGLVAASSPGRTSAPFRSWSRCGIRARRWSWRGRPARRRSRS